jgi:ADP-heptose:LPS heptosyltransferase/glycosyltransferase involved in cell wall biosynthesis
MQKKTILFVGEHPYGMSGNSHMMDALLREVDYERFDVICFAIGDVDILVNSDTDKFKILPAKEITQANRVDPLGFNKFLSFVQSGKVDAILFVGIDVWPFAPIYQALVQHRAAKGMQIGGIFPFDLIEVRDDWIAWFQMFDYVGIYSKYGVDMLSPHVPCVEYFRPPYYAVDTFAPLTEDEVIKARRELFPHVIEDAFMFGFVGKNQIRKDPATLIRAFAKAAIPNSILYMHTNMSEGVYNLQQIALDAKVRTGQLITCNPTKRFTPEEMARIVGSLNCLVNPSMQEGLSWTVVEVGLCNVPVIATKTTAQTELLQGGHCFDFSVHCQNQTYIPIGTAQGITHVPTRSCTVEDLADSMHRMVALSPSKLQEIGVDHGNRMRAWCVGSDDVNVVLVKLTPDKPLQNVVDKVDKILFAQHSAAGDVFMTTRCLKGLKERHGNIPLVYMTKVQYHDILQGNPYVDEIVDWDDALFNVKFTKIYNIHHERIGPGHWGRNANSILSDFYWKLLYVEPDDFFIEKVRPKRPEVQPLFDTTQPIAVVHTTGGDPAFRTYRFMGDVSAYLLLQGYFVVQVGSATDYSAGAALNLCGLLSFRETAWVMSRAILAMTVDSFVSHLAGALGVSQVALYGSGNAMVCRPHQTMGKLICLSPDYIRRCKGLGPCSASIRDCPLPCTGWHNPMDIIAAIRELEDDINDGVDHIPGVVIHRYGG